MVVGLARAHAAAARPFRAPVTASTHVVIDSLLGRAADLGGGAGPAVGKVKAWHGPPAGDAVRGDGLGARLAGRPAAVAGATVRRPGRRWYRCGPRTGG